MADGTASAPRARTRPALLVSVPEADDKAESAAASGAGGASSLGSPKVRSPITPTGSGSLRARFCAHRWAPHKRAALKWGTANCENCSHAIGRFEKETWKCSLCKSLLHGSCIRPHEFVVVQEGMSPMPYSSLGTSGKAGLLVKKARRTSALPELEGRAGATTPVMPADVVLPTRDAVHSAPAAGTGNGELHDLPAAPQLSPAEASKEIGLDLLPLHTDAPIARSLRTSASLDFVDIGEISVVSPEQVKRLNSLSPSVRRSLLFATSTSSDDVWPRHASPRSRVYRRSQSSPLARSARRVPSWSDSAAEITPQRAGPGRGYGSLSPGSSVSAPSSSIARGGERVGLTRSAAGSQLLPNSGGGSSVQRAIVPSSKLPSLRRIASDAHERPDAGGGAGRSHGTPPSPQSSPAMLGPRSPTLCSISPGIRRVMSDELDLGETVQDRHPSSDASCHADQGRLSSGSRSPMSRSPMSRSPMSRSPMSRSPTVRGPTSLHDAGCFVTSPLRSRSLSLGSTTSESSSASAAAVDRVHTRVDIPRPSDSEARASARRLDRSLSSGRPEYGLPRKRSPLHNGAAQLQTLALRSCNSALRENASGDERNTQAVRRQRRVRSDPARSSNYLDGFEAPCCQVRDRKASGDARFQPSLSSPLAAGVSTPRSADSTRASSPGADDDDADAVTVYSAARV